MAATGADRRARAAVLVHFFGNGAGLGVWAARLPSIKDSVGISHADVGTVLFAGGAAALLTLRLAGPVIERVGSRRVVQLAGALAMASFATVAAVTSFASLVAAMVLIAAAMSFQDVGMNAQGIFLERRYGRPLMSSFHAAFSIGLAAGATSGGAAAAAGVGFRMTLVVVAALLLAGVLAVNPWLALDPVVAPRALEQSGLPAALPHRGLLVALGLIGLISFVAEGAVVDWTALYLAEETGAPEARAAMGVVAFSAAMVGGRLAGDHLAGRFGPLPLIVLGTLVAGSALVVGLALGTTTAGIVCLAVVGVGLSVVVPQVFAAAGTLAPDRTAGALSLVSMLSYTGFLIGPAAIGRLAEQTSIRAALLAPAVLVLVASGIALRLRRSVGSRPPTRPRQPVVSS